MTKTSTKKIHPADKLDRDAVLTAASFSTFLRRSPTSKVVRPAATLALAIGHVDNIKAELAMDGVRGKVTPLVYAIQDDGTQSPVPADMIEEARAGRLEVDPAKRNRDDAVASRLDSTADAFEAVGAPTPAAAIVRGRKDKAPTSQPVAKVSVAKLFSDDPLGLKAARKARADKKAVPLFAGKGKAGVFAVEASTVTPGGKRAAVKAFAEAGVIPDAPDFSPPSHKRFRGRLDAIAALVGNGAKGVKAKDWKAVRAAVKALKADSTEAKSSSRVMICRYRDLAVVALEAQLIKGAK